MGPTKARETAAPAATPPSGVAGGLSGSTGAPGTSEATRTRTNYRPDIDGIRGAAAIMVMGYHAKVPGFEGAYIGLDLFFVVSGFVIINLLLSEFNRSGGIKWSAFYARRARRLIPAKATMLLGVLILSYFVLTPTGSQQETAKSAAAAAGFVSNFFFWRSEDIDYFGHQPGTGVLLHTWSLSVEEQFYLFLPLAILLAVALAKLLRVNVRRTLLVTTLGLGVASLLLAVAWAGPHPQAAYYLPMTRAYEFLIGVALALVCARVTLPHVVRQVMGLIGGALIAYVLIVPMPTDGYPNTWALVPCAGAMLMTWAGTGSSTWITKLLSFRLFVGLGLVSYGWYLWHWPLLVMGESVNLAPPPLWARVALIMVALLLAYLSWRFIEGLFYKRSGEKPAAITWGPRRVVMAGITSMSMVALLATSGYLAAKDLAESPRWEKVEAQLNDVPAMPAECLNGDEIIPTKLGACYLNDFVEDRPSVVLWGDSHAWMYIPALEEASADLDVNLVAFVQGGCPPFDPTGEVGIKCSRNNKMALNFVRDTSKTQPIRVILGAQWETYRGAERETLIDQGPNGVDREDYVKQISSLFQNGAPTLFEKLGRFDIPTDVISPTAQVLRNAPLCTALPRPFSCNLDRKDAIVDEASTLEWLKDQMADLDGNPQLIDTADQMCNKQTCFAETRGMLTFFDDNHLSATFSRSLSPLFIPSVKSLT